MTTRTQDLGLSSGEIAQEFIAQNWIESPNSHNPRLDLAHDDRRKARCFRKGNRTLYLKVSPREHDKIMPSPLVFAAEDEAIVAAMLPTGVRMGGRLAHGSMFRRFSTRKNRGQKEEHYGMTLIPETVEGLGQFLMLYAA